MHPADLWTYGEMLCLLPRRRSHTEVIERTGYAFSTLLQNLGVDHGVDRREVVAAVNSLELFIDKTHENRGVPFLLSTL